MDDGLLDGGRPDPEGERRAQRTSQDRSRGPSRLNPRRSWPDAACGDLPVRLVVPALREARMTARRLAPLPALTTLARRPARVENRAPAARAPQLPSHPGR